MDERREWEPMDTAPKDGRRIEFRNVDNGLTDVGEWCDYTHVSQSERDERWPEFFRNADGTWPNGEWSTDHGNGEMTHWRPLPDPQPDGQEG